MVNECQHVSEITLWLKVTGIHVYLLNIKLADLATAYIILKLNDEPVLITIYDSISRILCSAMSVLVHDQNKETWRLS